MFDIGQLKLDPGHTHDWSHGDGLITATLGTADREDAVAGWEACMIADPIGHERARYSGKVMHGTITNSYTDASSRRFVLASTDNCRYREGDRVRLTITIDDEAHVANAELIELSTDADGTGTMLFRPTGKRTWLADVASGQHAVVTPPKPFSNRTRDRELIIGNYKAAGWILDTTKPAPSDRRDVPVEVWTAALTEA